MLCFASVVHQMRDTFLLRELQQGNGGFNWKWLQTKSSWNCKCLIKEFIELARTSKTNCTGSSIYKVLQIRAAALTSGHPVDYGCKSVIAAPLSARRTWVLVSVIWHTSPSNPITLTAASPDYTPQTDRSASLHRHRPHVAAWYCFYQLTSHHVSVLVHGIS